MLSLLQRAPRPSFVARSYLRAHPSVLSRRNISATSIQWSTSAPEPPTPEEEDELAAASDELGTEVVPEKALEKNESEGESEEHTQEEASYKQFLSSVGVKFKYARPNNWLGGDVPFPMNPSFKPPPPLSDALRQEIYNTFMRDPEENHVRSLSQRYHLSLKRIDAILRLKGLEHSWYKNKPIQYGFQRGMEKLLGVKTHKTYEGHLRDKSRWDAAEADRLEQDEKRDAQRQRYQRHYWESVPEDGREPIVPAALEDAKRLAQEFVKSGERQKSTHPRLIPEFPATERIKKPQRFQTLENEGKPTLEIRDVRGKFLDLNDSLKRISVGNRRVREKEKKREKRKADILHTQS